MLNALNLDKLQMASTASVEQALMVELLRKFLGEQGSQMWQALQDIFLALRTNEISVLQQTNLYT